MERKNAWESYSAAELKKVYAFAEDYRSFLSDCKTERECTAFFVEKAKKAGFLELGEVIAKNKKLKAGDKVYPTNYGKAIACFIVGKEPMEKGINILGGRSGLRRDRPSDPSGGRTAEKDRKQGGGRRGAGCSGRKPALKDLGEREG